MARRRPDGAFSLVEALVAITILGMAGSAILLATQASMQATNDALDRTIASGIASQLVDEIFGLPYKEAGQDPEAWPLGPESGEWTAEPTQRIYFDDIDDYAGYASTPPRDRYGMPLGSENGEGSMRWDSLRLSDNRLADWSVAVDVRYVDPDDLSQDLPMGQTGPYRAVTVVVRRGAGAGQRILARIRRVCSYVPPPA